MVPVDGPSSNTTALSALHASTNPNAYGQAGHGFERSGSKERMVPVDRLDWNQFFELLEEWNRDLEALGAPELGGPENGP